MTESPRQRMAAAAADLRESERIDDQLHFADQLLDVVENYLAEQEGDR